MRCPLAVVERGAQGKKGGSEKGPAKHTCLVSSSELSTLGPNDRASVGNEVREPPELQLSLLNTWLCQGPYDWDTPAS